MTVYVDPDGPYVPTVDEVKKYVKKLTNVETSFLKEVGQSLFTFSGITSSPIPSGVRVEKIKEYLAQRGWKVETRTDRNESYITVSMP